MFSIRDLACLFVFLAMATDTSLSDSTQQLSAGNAKFTSAFFDKIRGKPGNLFFSPISIEAVLALAHAGAAGKTALQIQQAAHLPETRETTAKLYGDLMKSFQTDGNVTLSLANGVYADKHFTIKPDYLNLVQNGFNANLGQVEFEKADEAAATINEFVAKNTNNKITELFNADAFSAATKLVLLNAIYFKGDWADKFPESSTTKGLFHLNAKEQKEVDYMHIKKKFVVQKSEELDAQIVEIPYKGDSVSMVLIVPNTVEGLSTLEPKIASTDLRELLKTQNKREVLLTMPKFKLDETVDLKDLLVNLGITDLFSEKDADLSGIADQPLFASKAIQKAYIEVNEAGSEAAAATGFTVGIASLPPPPLTLTLDHPFVFYLTHKATGTALFMGRVSSPEVLRYK